MGHHVFVSYKYSDAVMTRERIRLILGKEGHIYNGEKGFVALQNADSTIKEYLKEMIFGTTVTLVVISPQVKYSSWVDWEIRYSLRQLSRDGEKSYRNGILCVIQNNTDWFGHNNCNWARDRAGSLRKDIFPEAIIENLQTTFPSCNPYMWYSNSTIISEKDYCVIVGESAFLSNPSLYIETAYNRAKDTSYRIVVNK